MGRGPCAQLFNESVYVIAGLGGELVFNSPNFLQNRVRFHRFNSCSKAKGSGLGRRFFFED